MPITGQQLSAALNARVADAHKVSRTQSDAILALLISVFPFAVQVFNHLVDLHGLPTSPPPPLRSHQRPLRLLTPPSP
jgi:hypothetical protein